MVKFCLQARQHDGDPTTTDLSVREDHSKLKGEGTLLTPQSEKNIENLLGRWTCDMLPAENMDRGKMPPTDQSGTQAQQRLEILTKGSSWGNTFIEDPQVSEAVNRSVESDRSLLVIAALRVVSHRNLENRPPSVKVFWSYHIGMPRKNTRKNLGKKGQARITGGARELWESRSLSQKGKVGTDQLQPWRSGTLLTEEECCRVPGAARSSAVSKYTQLSWNEGGLSPCVATPDNFLLE